MTPRVKRNRTSLASDSGREYTLAVRRTERLNIRVTVDEFTRIHAEAARLGVSITTLVLSRTLGE